jgi:Flp pilus assembly protein TadB
MPRRRFDKDIELAKLQARISEQQADYYTVLAVALTAAFASIGIGNAVTGLAPFFLFAAIVLICFSVVMSLRYRRDRSKLLANFGRVYKKQRIVEE